MDTGSHHAKPVKKYSKSVVFVPKDTKEAKKGAHKRPFLFKLLLLLSFLVFTYGCCNHSGEIGIGGNRESENVDHATRSTVAFVLDHPRLKNIPYCTGFFVRDNRIASAAHCFIETISVRLPEGREAEMPVPGQILVGKKVNFIRFEEYNSRTRRNTAERVRQAEIISIDSANDAVILKPVSEIDNSVHVLTLAPSQTRERIGTKVFTIGHPANLPFTYLEGVISKLIADHDGTPFVLQATVPVSEGCSGGALINLSTGEVIGMSDAYVGRMHHLAIFISAHSINRLLQHEENRTPISAPPGRH